ncbi:hypothetical protein [Pseudonocardia zijingensis]|uniref:Uncharacterized protein n=1 Tax=Pseudonocardia zijingensis TaxID=153376 RepID=A0ABP3YP08_9PSEU
MTDFGEQVLVALADQGFGLTITEEEVTILTPDGRRKHRIPAAYFERNAREHLASLIVVVIGLEVLEGFVPPESFDPDRE